MAKSKLRILYGEGDEEVLKAQAAAMEKAGHTVAAGRRTQGRRRGSQKDSVRLVVLGPTLTRNDRHHLPYMVKKANAETSVLVMHADGSRHPYVDACTDTGASLESVLNRIECMNIAGMMRQRQRPPQAARPRRKDGDFCLCGDGRLRPSRQAQRGELPPQLRKNTQSSTQDRAPPKARIKFINAWERAALQACLLSI